MLKDQAEIFPLHLVYCLVIDNRQTVQLGLFLVETFGVGCFFELAHPTKVGIHGVKCVNGNAVVRVRIRPTMRHGGVIHRQNLHHLLVRLNRPVNQ
ncbi:hypothetical protein SDC9_118218 [bioreactor metagenome]|uniref:Uncharacterized protein n=1 Tax=bioreactor metagenome TaxID=1076179 RepID=A0A645C140_9ZZZZ